MITESYCLVNPKSFAQLGTYSMKHYHHWGCVVLQETEVSSSEFRQVIVLEVRDC